MGDVWLYGMLFAVLLAMGGALRWFAVGLPERDAKYRMLALVLLIPIAAASVLGTVHVYLLWPWWLALPVGLLLLAAGISVVYVLVGRVLPSKIRRSE